MDCSRPGKLLKVDTRTGQVQPPSSSQVPLPVLQVSSWSEPNTYCSEPLFVGTPGGRGEDSGLLLCSLLWGKPRVASTAVLVLDARDLSVVARSEVLGSGQTGIVIGTRTSGWWPDYMR